MYKWIMRGSAWMLDTYCRPHPHAIDWSDIKMFCKHCMGDNDIHDNVTDISNLAHDNYSNFPIAFSLVSKQACVRRILRTVRSGHNVECGSRVIPGDHCTARRSPCCPFPGMGRFLKPVKRHSSFEKGLWLGNFAGQRH